MKDRLISFTELAEMLGVSKKHIRYDLPDLMEKKIQFTEGGNLKWWLSDVYKIVNNKYQK